MKKILVLLAVIFCFSTLYAADSGMFSAYPYKSASWKSKTSVDGPDGSFTFEQTVLLKGKKMRTEGKFLNRATNEKENQVTIIDGDVMYSMNPDKKQGMKYSLKGKNSPDKSDPMMNNCREKAKKTGSETIRGVKCDRYEYTCRMGNADAKITEYRNKKGFPVKTVSKTGGTATTVETYDLKENASIPDSKFVPDKGTNFMDMDKIMSGDPIMNKKMKAVPEDEDEDASSEIGQKMMKDMMKGMFGE